MSVRTPDSCLTFCTPKDYQPGTHEIQWQFPKFTVTCTSINLRFTQEILAFVAETRNNPKYRDTPLDGGIYRYIEEKSIDLSQYFQGVQLRFQKLGESDHSYFLRFDCPNVLSLDVELRTPEMIGSFLDGINEIIEHFLDESEA